MRCKHCGHVTVVTSLMEDHLCEWHDEGCEDDDELG